MAYCRSDTLLEEQSRTVSEPAGEIGSIDFFGPRGSSLAPESLLAQNWCRPTFYKRAMTWTDMKAALRNI
jgi:hypothetical protein